MGDRPSDNLDRAPTLISVDAKSPDQDALKAPARALSEGALVAFPTETVYGLGANALSAEAISRIYAAKGRPATNPLIVHIARIEDVENIVTAFTPDAQKLARTFWPGPLTLILGRKNTVPGTVSAGLSTVAVRMPAHPVARALIALAGCPVAAPSANRYTEVSPTRAEHVLRGLGARVDYIIDAGPTSVGLESTVLSLVEPRPTILRPGMITREEIARVLPAVIYAQNAELADTAQRPSPGLARRHYSPQATLRVVDDLACALADYAAKPAAKIGLILHAASPQNIPENLADLIAPDARLNLGDDPARYAHKLYDALHHLDQLGCTHILVQTPPQGDPWRAIHDRLARAAD